MTRSALLAAALGVSALLCHAVPAEAQISPAGASFLVASVAVRGTMSAYDSKNHVYLVVGAYGDVNGRFVRGDGTFLGDPFRINTDTTDFSHYPGVAYSPDADNGNGAFLVTWHQMIPAAGTHNRVRARLVSATSGMIGTELMLGSEDTFWETAPNVTYATFSKSFLVVWRIAPYQIRAARITAGGVALDQAGLVVTATGGEQDPSVGYNPATDNFLVAYADFIGGTHVYARLVSASTGAVGAPQLLGAGTGTYLTDVSYSPRSGNYLVVWYQLPGGTLGRLVDPNGNPASDVIPLSTRFGSYDGLGVAYSNLSGTYLMVGSDQLTLEDGGVELSEAGTPGSAGGLTNAGGPSGNYYPRVSASTSSPQWMLTTSHNFNSLVGQLVTSASTPSGTVAVIPPPPPPPPPPPSILSLSVNHSLPAVSGTSLTWTAVAAGGVAPLQYQFSHWKAGPGWFVVQPFSASNTFTQTFGAGVHKVRIEVKSTSGTTTVSADSVAFKILTTPALSFAPGLLGAALAMDANGTTTIAAGSPPSAVKTLPDTAPGDYIYPADFNGDGLTDFIVYNPLVGGGYKEINDGAGGFIRYPLGWGAGWWSITIVDFDGDGLSDVFLYNPNIGVWWRFMSTGAELLPRETGTWATGWQITPGDFNGDGFGDLFLYNGNAGDANHGLWFRVFFTPNVGFSYQLGDIRWASYWHITAADFDANGTTDLFLSAPNGTWFKVFFTPTGAIYDGGLWALGWTVVPGDFNGDGATDLFLYNAATGKTMLAYGTGGTGFSFVIGPQWAPGWQIAPTDLNGDGLTDLMLYNANTGLFLDLTMSGVGILSQGTGFLPAGLSLVGRAGQIF